MAPRLRDWLDDPDGGTRDLRPPTVARLHTEAVRALARRELTTLQLRDKLAAAGGRGADIDAVLARLAADGALDDGRAARVYARVAFRSRRRARARIAAELQQLGIDATTAREVVDEVCNVETERQRLDQAVIHALRGTRRDQRDADVRRLLASLVRQGYEEDDVRAALRKAGADT